MGILTGGTIIPKCWYKVEHPRLGLVRLRTSGLGFRIRVWGSVVGGLGCRNL